MLFFPGEEFASKFSRPPEQHIFPVAGVGPGGAVAVSVRSLPRSDDIPSVVCSHTPVAAAVQHPPAVQEVHEDEEVRN